MAKLELTEQQRQIIIEKTGAENIDLLRRSMIKPERIESNFVNEIDNFVYTNSYDQRLCSVGGGNERTRKSVTVTTKTP